jgi:hypothetical protein
VYTRRRNLTIAVMSPALDCRSARDGFEHVRDQKREGRADGARSRMLCESDETWRPSASSVSEMPIAAHQAVASRACEHDVGALHLHIVRPAVDRNENSEGVTSLRSRLRTKDAVDLSVVFEPDSPP